MTTLVVQVEKFIGGYNCSEQTIAERVPLAIAGRTTDEVWNWSRTCGANGTNRKEDIVLLCID